MWFPAFGFRQRLLRRAHQIFHRRIILRQRQNAGVELHVHLAERAKIVGRLQRRHDARQELAFRAVGQIVHQYQKQAAGIAADVVAGADQRLEALADGAQHVIANLDAVALVERSQRTELRMNRWEIVCAAAGRQMLRITTSPPARLRKPVRRSRCDACCFSKPA